MKNRSLVPLALILSLGLAYTLTAGPLDPPPGAVVSTGRFGPRVDVLALPVGPFGIRTITQSGSYYLSGNLDGSIRIEAPNVTVDLNGQTIDALGEDGIRAGSGASGGVLVVKNGHLINATQGMPVSTLEIVVIDGVTIRDCSNTGINVNNSARATIKNCVVLDCGGAGIRTVGIGFVTDCVSTGNVGFDIAADFSQVRGCVAGTILAAQSVDNYLTP